MDFDATYKRFLESGAYILARLLYIRIDTVVQPSRDRYDILSLLSWQENDRLYEELTLEMYDAEASALEFVEHFDAVLDGLPDQYGRLFRSRFFEGTKKREDGIEYHFLHRKMFPALMDALRTYSEYDFANEGLSVASGLIRRVNEARMTNDRSRFIGPLQPGKELPKFPIEQAVEMSRIYKRTQKANFLTQELDEFAETFDASMAQRHIHLNTYVKSLGNDQMLVSSELSDTEEALVTQHMFHLFIDGKFAAMDDTPFFLVKKEKIIGVKKIKIVAVPKIVELGDVMLPKREAADGHLIRLTIDHFPAFCRYELIRQDPKQGNVPVRISPVPEFFIDAEDPAIYLIRIIKDDDKVDDALTIKRIFHGTERRSSLERSTNMGSSKKLLGGLYRLVATMTTIRSTFPARFDAMMKYREKGNIERRIETFWLLAALCADLDGGDSRYRVKSGDFPTQTLDSRYSGQLLEDIDNRILAAVLNCGKPLREPFEQAIRQHLGVWTSGDR